MTNKYNYYKPVLKKTDFLGSQLLRNNLVWIRTPSIHSNPEKKTENMACFCPIKLSIHIEILVSTPWMQVQSEYIWKNKPARWLRVK